MNCTELVAHRLSTPLIRPSLPRIKPQRWRWCSHGGFLSPQKAILLPAEFWL
jgi:hypothetical protein